MKRLIMSKAIRLTDDDVVTALKQLIEDSDSDDVARMAAEYLGGTCEVRFSDEKPEDYEKIEMYYAFAPDENYGGAFDEQAKAQGIEVKA